jgi:glycosyltransferase involved in cell wall biosynthesis
MPVAPAGIAMHRPPLNRIAFVGNYSPRRCGLATFTRDLRNAVATALPEAECLVVAMNDRGRSYDYPAEVRVAFDDADPDAPRRAAEWLNLANADVVSLQHEYGIFGGPAGSHVLHLLRDLRMPVHTTLHTVLARPAADQRRVMDEVLSLSTRVAVMTERGRDLLQRVYGVADERIDVIPHGIPETEFVDPNFHKDRFGIEGADVLLTFGLLSPNKGIEHVIAAMPEIVARHPRAVYLVVGATHPHLLREHGEGYRDSLVRLANDLGVANHVVFHDRYVDMEELLAFIGAADIYVTPYLNEDQITSGTLAYAFGCGKAVLSTPYWHALELLADGRGIVVPFRDPAAIAREAAGLLSDPARRHSMRKRAWMLGRDMIWGRVADRYLEAFARVRLSTLVRPRHGSPPGPALPVRRTLPAVSLEHVWRLTDSTGMLQHATYHVPARSEGYCTDDNARALTLMVLLDDLGLGSPQTARAAATYAAFVGHAFDPSSGRFRNFMTYDRRWLDDSGSDDCLGRAIVALGTCIGRSPTAGLRAFAMRLFEPAIRAILTTPSPRGWALAILGIEEYLRRFPGDRLAATASRSLTTRLLDLQAANAGPDWPWFEDIVAYENARPCQALIAGGRRHDDGRASDVGMAMLEWLAGRQSAGERFSPIGCRGFLPRGGVAAVFDQQPLEAQAMVAACCEAFRTCGAAVWLDRAWNAFAWFHGRNVLGTAVVDPRSGGCRDGLLEDRANENQGAESTLASLAAVVDLRLLESFLAASVAMPGPAFPVVGEPRPSSSHQPCSR